MDMNAWRISAPWSAPTDDYAWIIGLTLRPARQLLLEARTACVGGGVRTVPGVTRVGERLVALVEAGIDAGVLRVRVDELPQRLTGVEAALAEVDELPIRPEPQLLPHVIRLRV